MQVSLWTQADKYFNIFCHRSAFPIIRKAFNSPLYCSIIYTITVVNLEVLQCRIKCPTDNENKTACKSKHNNTWSRAMNLIGLKVWITWLITHTFDSFWLSA